MLGLKPPVSCAWVDQACRQAPLGAGLPLARTPQPSRPHPRLKAGAAVGLRLPEEKPPSPLTRFCGAETPSAAAKLEREMKPAADCNGSKHLTGAAAQILSARLAASERWRVGWRGREEGVYGLLHARLATGADSSGDLIKNKDKC